MKAIRKSKGKIYMTKEEFERLKKETPNLVKKNLDEHWGFGIPIDAVAFAIDFGFEVHSIDLPDRFDGILLVDETGKLTKEQQKRRIAINRRLKKEDIRFVVMHEISHYIVHKFLYDNKKVQIAIRDCFFDAEGKHITGKRSEFENHIDYMAACFLMPTDDVINDLRDLTPNNKDIKIEFLMKKYVVSKETAKRRIDEVSKELDEQRKSTAR